MRWSPFLISKATEIFWKEPASWVAEGVSIDSRTIQANQLFLSFKPEPAFIQAAQNCGAVGVIFDRMDPALRGDDFRLTLGHVPNTLKALWDMARYAREQINPKRIALTGSVGKTTLRQALAFCLGSIFRTYDSYKNYNNRVGTPYCLVNMPEDTTLGIFELGMSEWGEIGPLAQLVRPDIAILHSIHPVHLEQLKTLRGIALAKAEIFSALHPGGIPVICRDIPYFDEIERICIRPPITYGFDPRSDIHLTRWNEESFQGFVSVNRTVFPFQLSCPGKPLLLVALGVIATAVALGLPPQAVLPSLKQISPEAGRGRLLPLPSEEDVWLLDDSYNASPASVQESLKVLKFYSRKMDIPPLVILGDMRELGPDAQKFHDDLAPLLEGIPVLLLGEHMRKMGRLLEAHHIKGEADTVNEIKDQLQDILLHRSQKPLLLLIKGSLSTGLNKLAKTLHQQENVWSERNLP